MDELQIIFDRIEAERVVVFLDACYSGAAGGHTFASKRTRALRVDDVFLDRLARSRGRAIIRRPAPPKYRSSCPSWATVSSRTISCKGSEARRISTATAS